MVIVRRPDQTHGPALISMKNSAKAIASGDYSLKVIVDGDDEIADLGRSLNSLSRDLEQFVLKRKNGKDAPGLCG